MRVVRQAGAAAAALLIAGCASPAVVAPAARGPELPTRSPAPTPTLSTADAPGASPTTQPPTKPASRPDATASPSSRRDATARPERTPQPAAGTPTPHAATGPATPALPPSLSPRPSETPAPAPSRDVPPPAPTASPEPEQAIYLRPEPGATLTPSPNTQLVIVDPIDHDGTVRAGYAVRDLPVAIPPVDCSADPGSPAAVTAGLHGCAELALATTACWATADAPGALVCLSDAWSAGLVRLPARDVGPTRAAAEPVPFGVQLTDGTRWTLLRTVVLPGGPAAAVPAYHCESGCAPDEVLLRPAGGPVFDTGTALWTVHRGSLLDPGTGGAQTASVAAAYYLASGTRPEGFTATGR